MIWTNIQNNLIKENFFSTLTNDINIKIINWECTSQNSTVNSSYNRTAGANATYHGAKDVSYNGSDNSSVV